MVMLSFDSYYNFLVVGVVFRFLEFMEQGIFFIGIFLNVNKDLFFEWNEVSFTEKSLRCLDFFYFVIDQEEYY